MEEKCTMKTPSYSNKVEKKELYVTVNEVTGKLENYLLEPLNWVSIRHVI